ncbi:DoxX family protein [Phycisphaera mikurensis]|uniref:DoxX family protein n=1 Tax=Phycisphaera mikurensis (strain NBRC 102666 / KCTC 22515 / FYK2301M01) TaxID=1142394 RepID=I0IHP5_PHYMF|nr:DoxX family protein [Phycisphaera mikurensis]MBB6441028.1 putative membrane protein [Phycisphaera mikurensis]BAM04783.1 hypothetical protein PSMK_26240 [Phycisphaera mikurensis NBRC 102666]
MTWPTPRVASRWAAAGFFVVAGAAHFVRPELYLPLIPDALGAPRFWNAAAGAAEVAGGLGLLVPRLRAAAAAGLVVLLLVLLWVHVEMLIHPHRPVFGRVLPAWVLWARLPLQLVFIAWVVHAGGSDRTPPPRAQSRGGNEPMPRA